MQRTRYNAKARSAHKKKAKHRTDKQETVQDRPDPNATIVVPKTEEEKEQERKLKMREEMLAELDSKANSKKKKRLDKYIEKKLKQEERVDLFEKLSKSQAQASAALHLQSSATLGTGKPSTHLRRLEKEEDLDVRRALDGRAGKGKRRRNDAPPSEAGDREESDEDAYMDIDRSTRYTREHDNVQEGMSRSRPVVIVDSGFSTAVQSSGFEDPLPSTSVIGSALRHNSDGTTAAPKISKRKPKHSKAAFTSWKDTGSNKRNRKPAEDSDASFDSSDSAYDSVEEADEQSGADDASDNPENSDAEEAEEPLEEPPQAPSAEESGGTKRKRLGFKDWAMKQLSVAKGYIAPPPDDSATTDPTLAHVETAPPPKKRKTEHSDGPREMRGPLGEDLQLPHTSLAQHMQESAKKTADGSQSRKRKVVSVSRPSEVEEARLLLPIVAEEQPIMEAILLNSVVIICGETGSGKTTQVPQFLFEAGFGSAGSDNPGMIGVTQPRRVAAMSMASRVAHELSLASTRVSYQIRYDATVSPSTSIKFMTDGVLLRELATDFLLKKYSVIIIDEAHERSMNTDILIGVLSRVVKLREEMWKEGKDDMKPLRLIIMSATLRVADFAENTALFPSPPPIINVPARQHPVTVHFSRRTSSDYVTEAVKKASKIHARLPPGGILIFLTGQNEITGVCKKLETMYGKKAIEEHRKSKISLQTRLSNLAKKLGEDKPPAHAVAPAHADVEAEDIELGDARRDDEALAFDVDGDIDAEALDSDDEEAENEELGIKAEDTDVPMHIVPLYALLSSEKQMEVFKEPPPGTRLVVVATNVAETSLTIPGIRYVVDCGRAKERRYDVANGIQAFQVSWVSKASAAQRAGRAGRTGPGHCYRLYSSALFENYFDPFSQPEILRMPIEGVVLQMKSMHIDSVANFPFPTPPDRTSLRKAEKVLTHLGALAPAPGGAPLGGPVTEIGRTMALFPLSPRFSRMLVSGRQHGCLPYVIAIVAALSVGDPFLREEALEGEEDEENEELAHLTGEAARAKEMRRVRRKAFFQSQQLHSALGNSSSDVLRILSVVGAYEYAGGGHKFCEEHFVRPKAMEEIHKLRAQISSIVQTNFPDVQTGFEANLRPPNALQLKVLRQLIAAGFIDQIAVRKDIAAKGAASAGTGAQYTTARGVAYAALGIDEDVFLHPSSVLAGGAPPEYVVFLEVVRTSRVFVKGLTVANGAWLAALGRALCTYSKPVKNKDGVAMVIPHFGPQGWELPPIREDQK
ncbi:P-loop containing nucleoside triphosphate hydrolase protein [Trametes versicolor FP-101664 SS1]|uniref:P-loop containing nucleoside triphosphate hydrolase protein n=1 Tax=Trametes versicolor (strain FP-101664) TaxID=717944 RepID=UPI0004621DC1|nr:P-loop containing nucleoside triphosphate hydrolase protein [Trametes versicolor FP-101664 SS1]EIW64851.1 P-loop containing nucleoside triphosphate hydrolase protein [Trametes versicolor FP-101664 SS1]